MRAAAPPSAHGRRVLGNPLKQGFVHFATLAKADTDERLDHPLVDGGQWASTGRVAVLPGEEPTSRRNAVLKALSDS
jgi:hypothetical protein